MPFDESLFLKVKSRLEGIWNSWRVKKKDVLTHYENSLNRGFKYDYRKQYYNKLSEISLEDFKDYYQQWIQNSYFNLIVIGDSSQINKDYLKQFGEVHILKKEVIFGE